MAVEFALRPRIRLREGFAPPKRSRFRLPQFVLPVAAYWLVAAGLTYAFVRSHDPAATAAARASADESLATSEPTPRVERAWWQRTPAPAAPSATAESVSAPEPEPEPASKSNALTEPEAAPEPALKPDPPSEPEVTVERAEPPSRDARREHLPAQERVVSPRALAAPAFTAPEPSFPEPAPRTAALPSPSVAPQLPAQDVHARGSLPSCEAAVATSSQDVDFSQGNGTADLPTQVIAAVLENGAWLASCNVPPNTSLDVCVAIKGGNVVGATVVARPADSAVSACVRRRAAALQFPYSSHLDIARTRF